MVIIVITVIANRFSATKHLPPGPFHLPIIRNVHQMTSESRHVDLTATEKQYGPVIRLYLGSQLVIVVSGQTTIKEVLVTKSAEFAGRPNIFTSILYSDNGITIGSADYSPKWRLPRRFVVSALKMFTTSVLKQGSVVNGEVGLLLKRVQSTNGRARDITKEIRLTVPILFCALVFGFRYELDDPKFVKFLEITTGIFEMLASGSVADVLPSLRFLPFKAIQRFKKNGKERDEIVGRIYREHVEANRVQNPQDLTDALLNKAKKEAEEEDSSIRGFLTDQHLILTMAEIFITEMETTASTLCWALLYLIHHQEVQVMLQQELDEVIGTNSLPVLEDKKSLPLLKATITETLRITGGPFTVHKSTVDTNLQGYHVPKGTTVLINL